MICNNNVYFLSWLETVDWNLALFYQNRKMLLIDNEQVWMVLNNSFTFFSNNNSDSCAESNKRSTTRIYGGFFRFSLHEQYCLPLSHQHCFNNECIVICSESLLKIRLSESLEIKRFWFFLSILYKT